MLQGMDGKPRPADEPKDSSEAKTGRPSPVAGAEWDERGKTRLGAAAPWDGILSGVSAHSSPSWALGHVMYETGSCRHSGLSVSGKRLRTDHPHVHSQETEAQRLEMTLAEPGRGLKSADSHPALCLLHRGFTEVFSSSSEL